MNLKNIFHNFLLISGIVLWVFITLNFVVIPFESIRFMVFMASTMFWLYTMPLVAMTLIPIILMLIVSILIEKRKMVKEGLCQK